MVNHRERELLRRKLVQENLTPKLIEVGKWRVTKGGEDVRDMIQVRLRGRGSPARLAHGKESVIGEPCQRWFASRRGDMGNLGFFRNDGPQLFFRLEFPQPRLVSKVYAPVCALLVPRFIGHIDVVVPVPLLWVLPALLNPPLLVTCSHALPRSRLTALACQEFVDSLADQRGNWDEGSPGKPCQPLLLARVKVNIGSDFSHVG
jgi:hypothetical protein